MSRYRLVVLILLIFSQLYVSAQDNADREKQFISNTRQLIYEGKRSGEGYFSDDGKLMSFQSERDDSNPFYQIYLLNLESGDINRVSPGYGKTTCSFPQWHGNRVIFASTHLDPKAKEKQKEELDFRATGKKRRYSWDYDTTMDIFSANRDGSDIKRLTTAQGYDAEGGVSPDGKKIVFCSNRSAYDHKLTAEEKKFLEVDPSYFGEIYIMNFDGTGQTRLTNKPGYDGGPFFSPDGKRILWRHFSEDGMIANVYTMNLDGSDVRQITDFKCMSWAPYFYPTGDYIIFACNKQGFDNFELYAVDAAGKKEPVRVTYTAGFDGLPVFSPDGKKLAWTSTRTSSGAAQLFMADWNNQAMLDALAAAPLRGAEGQAPNFKPEIDVTELRTKVTYLASDELEGRMTGSKGAKLAAEYAVSDFTKLGLQPAGSNKGFLSEFTYIAGAHEDKQHCSLTSGSKSFAIDSDFVPCPFTMNGDASGDVVFAGYGIKTPDKSSIEYNSYSSLDVKNKMVLVLDGIPTNMQDDDRKALIQYSSFRYKALVARELGAKAILYIDADGHGIGFSTQDNTPGNSGILAAEITANVANSLLVAKSTNLTEVLKSFENPHGSHEFDLPNTTLKVSLKVDKQESTDNNVVGMIPANKPTDSYIIIGGHYDHLGYGETSSLARSDAERKQIHHGADDNASGASTVMELAEYFAQLKKDNPSLFTRNVVFVLWSGEELGLMGSAYFIQHPPIDLKKVDAYLNFDMVGRLKDNKLIMQGIGSSTEWKRILEKKNVAAGFNLILQDDPYVPTDAMSLYQGEVPVLCFFTGIHDDYHRPTDTADKIDYDGMQRIATFAANITKELLKTDVNLPYAKVAMSQSQSEASRGFTVYLGTIPDYTAEVEGVKLSGVREGGPADKAGIKKDDIIIGLAGKDIKNIYDYTYILGDLKPGEKVTMVVMRNGKKVNIDVTPEAKK